MGLLLEFDTLISEFEIALVAISFIAVIIFEFDKLLGCLRRIILQKIEKNKKKRGVKENNKFIKKNSYKSLITTSSFKNTDNGEQILSDFIV